MDDTKKAHESDSRMFIIASSDNNYTRHLGVMLTSLFENNKESNIEIYVIDGNISQQNKEGLSRIENKYGFLINYVKPDFSLFNKLPVSHYISEAAYYRLQIPDLVPKHVKRILYLDCDIIVNSSIENLWQSDLHSMIVGAVPDPWVRKDLPIKLKNSATWFNSGMLLIDVEEWRKMNITRKCLEFAMMNQEKIVFWDQDILNAVLENYWYPIELKYNCMTHLYTEGTVAFSANEITEAKCQPVIVHYTTEPKPWEYLCLHPLKNLYRKYEAESGLKQSERPKLSLGKLKKYLIEKYVPQIIREKYEMTKNHISRQKIGLS